MDLSRPSLISRCRRPVSLVLPALILLLSSGTPARAGQQKQVRVALIVATSTSRDGRGEAMPKLPHVLREAKRLSEVLRERAYFEHVQLLRNPTSSRLEQEISDLEKWLGKRSGMDVLLYVHLIGHAERRTMLLVDGPLEFEKLQQQLARIRPRPVLRFTVVDACSAEEVIGMGPVPELDERLAMKGEILLISASKGEQALYTGDLGPVYTHYLTRLMEDDTLSPTSLQALHDLASSRTMSHAAGKGWSQTPKTIIGARTEIVRHPIWNGRRGMARLELPPELHDCSVASWYGDDLVESGRQTTETAGRGATGLRFECSGGVSTLILPRSVQVPDSVVLVHPPRPVPPAVGFARISTRPQPALSANEQPTLPMGPVGSLAASAEALELTLFEPEWTPLIGLVGGLSTWSGEALLTERSLGLELRASRSILSGGLRLLGGLGRTEHEGWGSANRSFSGQIFAGLGQQRWQPPLLRLELRGLVGLDRWQQTFDDRATREGWNQQIGAEIGLLWSWSQLRAELALRGGLAHASGTAEGSSAGWASMASVQLGLFWQIE